MGFSAALARIKTGHSQVDLSPKWPHHGVGVVSEGFRAVEGMAASAVFGYAHGMYREKASVPVPFTDVKIPANLAVGFIGKLAAIGLDIFSHGRSNVAPHLSVVADAGLYSYAYSYGVAKGTQSAGRKVYILEAGKNAPAQLGDLQQTTVVGEIPRAVGGMSLSDDELAELGRPRK